MKSTQSDCDHQKSKETKTAQIPSEREMAEDMESINLSGQNIHIFPPLNFQKMINMIFSDLIKAAVGEFGRASSYAVEGVNFDSS